MLRTTSVPETAHLAQAIAAKHFTNRGYRIMWRGDQSTYGVAFVEANDACARYVEVRFTEDGLDAEVEIPARHNSSGDRRDAFIDCHVRDTSPPFYSIDVASVYVDRAARLARVRVSEGGAVCVLV